MICAHCQGRGHTIGFACPGFRPVNDPIEQVKIIIRRLVATGYQDLGELVAQEVANELKAIVFSEEEMSQLKQLAAKGTVQPK